MRRASVSLIVGVVLLWAGAAGAASPNLNSLLHGDYASTGSSYYVSNPDGFYPDFTPKSTNTSIGSGSFQGVWTFNGDGTGKRAGISLSIAPSGATSDEGQGSFTYTVTSPRTFVLSQEVWQGTYLTGYLVGVTYTQGPFLYTGTISEDRKSLTLTATEPYVQTTRLSTGYVGYKISYRLQVLFQQ